jgi:hypothetical protein
MPQPSAFLIPAQPLKPQSAYQADVKWSMEGALLFEQRFGFTTGTNPGEAVVPIKKKKRGNPCSRYSQAAHSLRLRAAKAHLHGARLLRTASSSSRKRRGDHLLARSRRLKRLARLRSKQAKHCQANLRLS